MIRGFYFSISERRELGIRDGLGAAEGCILGALDGSCDGLELGSKEGLGDSVGCIDGAVLGAEDSVIDGNPLG